MGLIGSGCYEVARMLALRIDHAEGGRCALNLQINCPLISHKSPPGKFLILTCQGTGVERGAQGHTAGLWCHHICLIPEHSLLLLCSL